MKDCLLKRVLEEDNGEKLIKNAEIGIQKKWLNEFESQYPNWMSNDMQKDKYGFISLEVYDLLNAEKEFSEWRDLDRIWLSGRK